MTPQEFIPIYGPTIGLLVYIILKDLIPFLKERLYPDLRADRQAELAWRKEREDRLLKIIEQNASAYTRLQETLETVQMTLGAMAQQMEQQAETQQRMSEDISGLYGHVGQQRPSRRRTPSS